MPLAFCIDGADRTELDATVSVLDRGFLFGDSVFEVLRTYGGKPFAMREHLERLARSCGAMGIELPVTLETLAVEVRRTIARVAAEDVYVRIVITRGRGPLHIDPTSARSPLRVVIVSPLLPLPSGLHEDGVEVATVRVNRATDHTRAAGSKTSAYVANMLALAAGRERGAYETMMVGEGGELSEGTTSNLFVVRAGILRTPPLSMGILPGITRDFVLRAALDLDIPICEQVLYCSDVEHADEAFLTSSLREVVPIVAMDGVKIGNGRPGPFTARLHRQYRVLVSGMAPNEERI